MDHDDVGQRAGTERRLDMRGGKNIWLVGSLLLAVFMVVKPVKSHALICDLAAIGAEIIDEAGPGDPDAVPDPDDEDVPCEELKPKLVTSPSDPGMDLAGAVNKARDILEAAGEDLTDANCGKIVELACTFLPGVGLLIKPGGNQYNGHSVDVLVLPDGSAYDAISNCGGFDGTPNQGTAQALCCSPDASATQCSGPNPKFMPCPG